MGSFTPCETMLLHHSDDAKKVERLSTSMAAVLDDRIKLKVMDATEVDPNDPDEPERYLHFFRVLYC
jgi:hypothetical protein